MQVLTTRAQSEGSLGMWNDAIRDDMAIHDLAVKKKGPLSFYAVATLSDASQAMCRSGQFGAGEANSRKAYEASGKAFGPKAGLTGGVAATLATCLIGLGRLDEASKLLEQIDIPTVTQLAGDPDWGAGVTLMQAQVAFKKKDYATARKDLQVVIPVFSRPNAEAYEKHAVESLSAELERVQKN
jgi:ATP/maltotriose-dependent transcriptional regulator MalT